MHAAQQRSIKASAELAALQAGPTPTNPLLRARQQTQLDRIKRQRQEADAECARLQQQIEGPTGSGTAKLAKPKAKKK